MQARLVEYRADLDLVLDHHALEDLLLLGAGRVADLELQHEAVDLGLGERVGALLLDRILRREDEKRLGEAVGGVAERHLALFHRFEERRLHLGGRAVDLVGEQGVGEDRAAPGLELALARIVDQRADEVGRQQVRGELDALEVDRQRPREGLRGEGLGEAGDAFDEHVAAGQQAHQQTLDEVVLADDDPPDLGLDLLQGERLALDGRNDRCAGESRCASRRRRGSGARGRIRIPLGFHAHTPVRPGLQGKCHLRCAKMAAERQLEGRDYHPRSGPAARRPWGSITCARAASAGRCSSSSLLACRRRAPASPFVIEIGPGGGVLTAELLAAGAEVLALELDPEWAEDAALRGCASEKLSVKVGDVLDFDWAARAPRDPGLRESALPARDGDRGPRAARPSAGRAGGVPAAARGRRPARRPGPGTSEYGSLSLLTQARASVARLGIVRPGSFVPPPKVDSAFVGLRLHAATAAGG